MTDDEHRSLEELARLSNREHNAFEAFIAEAIEREIADGVPPEDVPASVALELALVFLEKTCPGLLDDFEEMVRDVQAAMSAD